MSEQHLHTPFSSSSLPERDNKMAMPPTVIKVPSTNMICVWVGVVKARGRSMGFGKAMNNEAGSSLPTYRLQCVQVSVLFKVHLATQAAKANIGR